MPEETDPQNTTDEFAAALGEPMEQVLDLNTWHAGADLARLYAALNQAVAESVEQEKRTRDPIRAAIIPRLRDGSDRTAPENAGLYRVTPEEIAEIHCGLLFNGATEACDGTVAAHDSLLLSIVQIGFALVAYQGSQGTWVQRLYRRDLRARYPDPVQEAMELLKRRGLRGADNVEEPNDPLSRLIRRTLMEYAERAALADLSTARWRMGHGNPVPTSMLLVTGGGTKALLQSGMEVLRRLLLQHRRFVYITSEASDRLLLTLGNALHPLEFAIVGTLADQFERLKIIQSRQAGAERAEVVAFMQEVGPEVVTGVYRAGEHAPPHVFYAHKDYACEAAALAIADSVLQPYRGFPMLIDLADILCGNAFDQASFTGTVQNAYAQAGEPTRYMNERDTRS
jgi:hypothetical protein